MFISNAFICVAVTHYLLKLALFPVKIFSHCWFLSRPYFPFLFLIWTFWPRCGHVRSTDGSNFWTIHSLPFRKLLLLLVPHLLLSEIFFLQDYLGFIPNSLSSLLLFFLDSMQISIPIFLPLLYFPSARGAISVRKGDIHIVGRRSRWCFTKKKIFSQVSWYISLILSSDKHQSDLMNWQVYYDYVRTRHTNPLIFVQTSALDPTAAVADRVGSVLTCPHYYLRLCVRACCSMFSFDWILCLCVSLRVRVCLCFCDARLVNVYLALKKF